MWWFAMCIHCEMITQSCLLTHPSPNIVSIFSCGWWEQLRSTLSGNFKCRAQWSLRTHSSCKWSPKYILITKPEKMKLKKYLTQEVNIAHHN